MILELLASPLGVRSSVQEVCYSYTDLLRPGTIRRSTLKAAYFFDCACRRCQLSTAAVDGDEPTKLARLAELGLD